MAHKSRSKVYLGYEDEHITDKNRSLVNFATNKIGGRPDLPSNDTCLPSPVCKLCGLHQLLALQIYAPLDNSKYHRTLYIFACINPNCWNHNESWTCLRVQSLDEQTSNVSDSQVAASVRSTTSWISSADDWGDEQDNISEQNGNHMVQTPSNNRNLLMETADLQQDLSNLRVDDANANSPASLESPVGGGAVGKIDSQQACAEIEGEESEVVCIDTPTQPQCNLIDLLREVTPHPFQHCDVKTVNFAFSEAFICVDEEDLSTHVPQHVRDLFLEYQLCNPDLKIDPACSSNNDTKIDANTEKYEKTVPKHGDETFHNFLSRIQRNPGQILRYCRDNSAPLLLHPLATSVGTCKYCGEDRTFEVQVLPTIIPKLKLVPYVEQNFEMDFGSVFVYTCSASCWSTNDVYKEEYVIVQVEQIY